MDNYMPSLKTLLQLPWGGNPADKLLVLMG